MDLLTPQRCDSDNPHLVGAVTVTHHHLVPWWSEAEIHAIRALYPHGGAEAVHQAIPHRTLAAIRAKARTERIRCSKPSTLGKRFERVWLISESIDGAIREAYSRAKRKGDIAAAAARIGRPAWWVQKRAAQLGITRTCRTRLDCWTQPELDILEHWRMATLKVIASKLRSAGYKRTQAAVAIQLKRRNIDRNNPDLFTTGQLADLFGVNAKTISDWIDRRGLLAKRTGSGPTAPQLVSRSNLRAWVKRNQQFVDLRKVDQPVFWEVMWPQS